MIKDQTSHFTLHISPRLLEKIALKAELDVKDKNKEIEQLIKLRIEEFKTSEMIRMDKR
jgi:hypothetical protein